MPSAMRAPTRARLPMGRLRSRLIRPVTATPPPADPQFGDVGNHLQGTASTMNVDVPDNVAVDDIIVVFAFVDVAATTITVLASGFAEAPDSPVLVNPGGGGQSHNLHILWKRATAADATGGTYDFTLSASVYRYARAARYWNCVTTGSPWDVTASANDVTNGTATPPVSDTTTGNNERVIWASTNWAANAAPSWTPPGSYTERSDIGDSVLTFADLTITTAGPTGSLSGSNTGSGARTAWIGALKPTGAADVRAQTGCGAVGAVGTGVAVHVAPAAARAAIGPAGTASQAKRAPVVASGVTAMASSGSVFHAGPIAKSGSSVVGVAARATGLKVAPQVSRSAAGAVGTVTAVRVAVQSGRGTLGVATRAAAVKKAVTVGAGTFGVVGTAVDRKVGPQSARAAAVVLTFGAITPPGARAQSGSCTLGVAGRAAAVKVAPAVAIATAGIAGRAAGVKRATPVTSCATGIAGRATVIHRAFPSGAASVAVTGSGMSGKRVPAAALCAFGVTSARISTARALSATGYVGVGSWHHHRVTRRPFLAATVRPGSGTTLRPYAGLTARP